MNALRFGTYIGGNSGDLINDFRVLSNGDVVFVGNTFGITEVNPSVPNNAVWAGSIIREDQCSCVWPCFI